MPKRRSRPFSTHSGTRAAGFRPGRWFVALCLGVLLGCTAMPVQEMSDARQAMQVAEETGAPERAPEAWAEAKALLEAAERALDEGDYSKARILAEEAREAAIRARKQAGSGR